MTKKMLFSNNNTYINCSEYVQTKKYLCAQILFKPHITCRTESCRSTVSYSPQETCHLASTSSRGCANIIHTYDDDCQKKLNVKSRCIKCRKTCPFFSDCQ